MRLTDENFEGYVRITTRDIQPDIERLCKQKERDISLIIDTVKDNYLITSEPVYNT